MNQEETNQVIDTLKAEAGIDWQAGQILLCHQSRYYDLGSFILIEDFQLGSVHQYGKKGETTEVPILEVSFKKLSGHSEESDFVWSQTLGRLTLREIRKSEWVVWSGSYTERRKAAVRQLDGGGSTDLQAELAGLLAGEIAYQSGPETGMLAKSSTTYYNQVMVATQERQTELIIVSRLMQMEVDRRVAELNQVMNQARGILAALVKKVERIQTHDYYH